MAYVSRDAVVAYADRSGAATVIVLDVPVPVMEQPLPTNVSSLDSSAEGAGHDASAYAGSCASACASVHASADASPEAKRRHGPAPCPHLPTRRPRLPSRPQDEDLDEEEEEEAAAGGR